jgi:Cft2 family RNA processing exonuclease
MLEWLDDLNLTDSDVYLDSRRRRSICFVSHAHTDHFGPHEHTICTAATERFARRGTELERITALDYFRDFVLNDKMTLSLLPAGHIVGSAMLHVRRGEQTLLYTGDFRLRGCDFVPPAQVRQADVLVMESTYGLPFFRFPPREQVAAQLLGRAGEAAEDFHASWLSRIRGYAAADGAGCEVC